MLRLEVTSGTSAQMAFAKAAERYPTLEKWSATVAFARGGHIIARDTPLHDGDELDVLPPVSGG